MFDWKVVCVMGGGAFLTDEVRTELFFAAAEMLQRGATKRNVKTGEIEGAIKTNLESVSFGTVTGPLFQAEIETTSGKRKMNYMVSIPKDVTLNELRDAGGVWVNNDPRRAKNAHLN